MSLRRTRGPGTSDIKYRIKMMAYSRCDKEICLLTIFIFLFDAICIFKRFSHFAIASNSRLPDRRKIATQTAQREKREEGERNWRAMHTRSLCRTLNNFLKWQTSSFSMFCLYDFIVYLSDGQINEYKQA